MFGLIPREDKYFDLFNEMAARINLATETLTRLFSDIANVERYAEELKTIEHECDDLAHDILKRLNKSFVTPIDREDIHALVTALDTIVDLIESASARVTMYAITESTPAMQELTRILAETGAAVGRSVAKLNSDEDVFDSLVEVHTLESSGDSVYRKAVRELFATNTDALSVLKHKEIYEKLENAIDACEDAANVLENISIKNS